MYIQKLSHIPLTQVVGTLEGRFGLKDHDHA